MKYIIIIFCLFTFIWSKTQVFNNQDNLSALEHIKSKQISEDSLDFIIFFKKIIVDKVERDEAFINCNSSLKKELNFRLDELDDYLTYRSELLNNDINVNVIFYNRNLIFFKALFFKSKDRWLLKTIEYFNDPKQFPVLNSLQISKKRIIYNVKCIDANFTGVIYNQNKIDTVYKARNLLKFSFSNSFIFFNENNLIQNNFYYRFIGLGSGINAYALYKNNCLIKYWDASN